MYIMIQDPETPGRRLYADITINERIKSGSTGIETEITDIEIDDVTTEAELSAAILKDLQHVELEPGKLKEVLRSHYRMFHITDEFYDIMQKYLYNASA